MEAPGMNYREWELVVPEELREDTLWRIEAYRLGLFLSDLAWKDVEKLLRDRRVMAIADQLYRAVGNISSNIAEGYSCGTGKDRARFYEYALGSAREARDWYFKSRNVLSTRVVDHRIKLCTEVVRLTITMASKERKTNRRITVLQD
jgi:four helix bundle protein